MQMKKEIVFDQERREFSREFREDEKRVQQAFAALRQITELQPLPLDLRSITTSWLSAIIKQKTALIMADKSLTEYERQNRLKAWRDVQGNAQPHVAAIERNTHKHPEAVWQLGEDGAPMLTNGEQLAAKMATHEIPDECHTHWHLITLCREAEKELRQWERQKNVKPVPNVATITEEAVAYNWVHGYALIPTK